MTLLARAVLLVSFAVALPVRADTLAVPGDHATVTAALAAAEVGDEIVVAPGLYAPSTNGETYPLVVPDGVTLRGAGMGSTILDAENTGRVILVLAGAPVVRDFTLTGGVANRGGGVQIEGGSPEIAHNLVWQNQALKRGSGINTQGTSTPWIHHNVVWENNDQDLVEGGDPHGIQCGESSAPLVEHNLVGRTDSNGLIAAENAAPVVRHNIFAWNGIPGVRGRGICNFGVEGTAIHHNLFFANEIAAMVMFDPENNVVDMTGVEANAFVDGDMIYGNLDGDPLLTDPDALDFALTTGSPAIDAGDPTLGTDPDGTTLDIGPFAFDTATDAPSVTPFALIGARPNPFNPATEIVFRLDRAGPITLSIVDARGRAVRTLSTERFEAGRHAVRWDGRDDAGRGVASGAYLVALRTAGRTASRGIVLVR